MEVVTMIIVAVDVAKDKHDCFITNTDGEILFESFVIPNSQDGFHDLFSKIRSVAESLQNVKVGLEATGHYHLNLLGYLLDKGFPTCLINPLQTSLFRKSLSFRKTKTDSVDARAIARIICLFLSFFIFFQHFLFLSLSLQRDRRRELCTDR
jgi:transposase